MSRVVPTASPKRLLLPALLQPAALALLYGISWQFLLLLSQALWFLPAGLRLGALWVNPSRLWPWRAAGEWASVLLVDIQIDIELSPFLEYPLEPHLLPAIADRVLAQQGEYTVTALNPGLRHHVHFENHGNGTI